MDMCGNVIRKLSECLSECQYSGVIVREPGV